MTAVLHHRLADINHLRYAWQEINKGNPESHGLSGESIARFEMNLQARLLAISQSLIHGSFKFSPTRAAVIPKDNGKYRPLQIPEIQDRVVLKAIALILEEVLKPTFQMSHGVSFAYQTGVGIDDAIEKVVEHHKAGKEFILEADIVNFFGEVNRDILFQKLFSLLPDDSLNGLILAGTSQPVHGLNLLPKDQVKLFENIGGIPQGNPLSPLLSNLYLSVFDQKLLAQKAALVRYADDFIVMCESIDEARKVYSTCKEILEGELKLQLHELGEENSKTRIVKIGDPFSFLSVSYDGKVTYPSDRAVLRLTEKITGIIRVNTKQKTVLYILSSVKNTLDGWITTFAFTNKPEKQFKKIDLTIDIHLLQALREHGWRLTKSSIKKVSSEDRILVRGYNKLSPQQRKSTGIPYCADILRSKKVVKKKPTVAKTPIDKKAMGRRENRPAIVKGALKPK